MSFIKKHQTVLSALLAAFVTFMVFLPALDNEFLESWDDRIYITENKLIKSLDGENLSKIVTEPIAGNYHPLTIFSLAVNYQFSELSPAAYVGTNVWIHLLNVVLLFYFIFWLTKGRLETAFIVALLFGIHPMHIEPVAWMSQRKDVLFAFFYFPALMCYLQYIRQRKMHFLAFSVLFYILSCASKPAAVPFPFLLFLLDYWENRKVEVKLFLEKIPFFIIALIVGLLTIKAQEVAIVEWDYFTYFHRIMFACYGFAMYIIKLFVPFGQSGFYAYPNLDNGFPAIYYIYPVISLLLIGATAYSFKKTKVVVFGMLFYLINVALVLQFVSVGGALISDRYTYMPYVGLLFILASGFSYVYRNPKKFPAWLPKAAMAAMGIYIVTMGVLAFNRSDVWQNDETLWSDVIQKYPDKYLGYANRGDYYRRTGQDDKAIADYAKSLQYKETDYIYHHRGRIMYLKGKVKEAIADYTQAIALKAEYPMALHNRALAYATLYDYDKAIVDYTEAIKHQPRYAKAYYNRGFAYQKKGDGPAALADYNKSIEQNPNSAATYLRRGQLYLQAGESDAAKADFSKAMQLQPNSLQAVSKMANAHLKLGEHEQAIQLLTKTIQQQPQQGNLYLSRAKIYAAVGDLQKARQDATKAQKMGAKGSQEFLNSL